MKLIEQNVLSATTTNHFSATSTVMLTIKNLGELALAQHAMHRHLVWIPGCSVLGDTFHV